MNYVVVNRFRDTDGTEYEENDKYPKKGKATKKRIAELSKKHPKYNCIFIKEVKEETKEEPKKVDKKANNKKSSSK